LLDSTRGVQLRAVTTNQRALINGSNQRNETLFLSRRHSAFSFFLTVVVFRSSDAYNVPFSVNAQVMAEAVLEAIDLTTVFAPPL
jgi:hypothetical protein